MTERARVNPKTLTALTRPRLIAAPPCHGRLPQPPLPPNIGRGTGGLERKLVKDG
jgi:hypothetical protein